MNLLLVIALCGNTFNSTEPPCSRDELAKCSEAPPDPPQTVEEELNRECRVTTCRLKIYHRCGIAVFERPIFPAKGYQRVVDAFCSKSSPLRTKMYKVQRKRCGNFSGEKCKSICVNLNTGGSKKFIENFRYISNIMDRKDKDFERQVMMCGYEDVPREEFCRKIPDVFSCLVDYISRNCGKDAGEVFGIAGLPLLDDYDCLSS